MFHVAYYEQPDALPLIGLEYGAYDAASGNWLHVALWAQGELPRDDRLARYRRRGPDGELEPAGSSSRRRRRTPQSAPRRVAARARRPTRARSGDGHIALALERLAFDAVSARRASLPASGRAEGDVRCDAGVTIRPAAAQPRAVGRHLVALPNPGESEARYTEDRESELGLLSRAHALIL